MRRWQPGAAVPGLLLGLGALGVVVEVFSVAIDPRGFGLVPAGMLLTLFCALLVFLRWTWERFG